MRRLHLPKFPSITGYYITDQASSDRAAAEILNNIDPTREQLYGDTEGGALPEWREEWENLMRLKATGKKPDQPYQPGLDPYKSQVRLLQVGFRKDVFVIDLFKVSDYSKWKTLLERGDIWSFWFNGKYDYKILLQNRDIVIGNILDYMAGARLIGLQQLNLKNLLEKLLGVTLDKEVRDTDWVGGELTDEQLVYAAEDVAGMIMARDPLEAALKKRGHWKAFFTESGKVAPAAEMELNGMSLDVERHAETVNALKVDIINQREEIWDVLSPHEDQQCLPGIRRGVNLKSPKALLAALRKMGLDVDATNKQELTVKALDNPVVPMILDYKKKEKLVDAFGDSLLRFVHPITGRVHPDYNLFWIVTYRFSCARPNLQQIPKWEVIREWWRAREGYKLVIADYSAIELIGAAVVSQDPRLLDIFRRRLRLGPDADALAKRLADPHYITAALLSQKHIMDVVKKERDDAKPANYGLLYGMRALKYRTFALVDYGLRLSEAQAVDARAKFFSADGYAGLQRWHDRSDKFYKNCGDMRTIAGYEIKLDWNPNFESYAGPACLNYQIQNPCAAGNARALQLLWKHYRPYMNKAKRWTGPMLTATVHDEDHLECPLSHVEEASRTLPRLMKMGMDQVLGCDDMVYVEAHAGDSWAEK